VDDSFVDRKVIERLLKISSCKGKLRPCLWFDYEWLSILNLRLKFWFGFCSQWQRWTVDGEL
jgi:hypothetical protein